MKITVMFRLMTKVEYEDYFTKAIQNYASNLIKCGIATKDNAHELSKQAFDEALPTGFVTPKANFYTVLDAKNDRIGFLWYIEPQEKVAYIGDFLIYEQYRGNGYGHQVLSLLETELVQYRYKVLALNVMEFNDVAISLYKKHGFCESKNEQGCIQMIKHLDSTEQVL